MSRRFRWRIVRLAVLLLLASCSTAQEVDRLTVVNATSFDVEVRLSDESKKNWQILGRADHRSSTLHRLVSDEGPTWVFQFHYGGKFVGEVTAKRQDLMRAGWRVEIPGAVADRMRRLGFDPLTDR